MKIVLCVKTTKIKKSINLKFLKSSSQKINILRLLRGVELRVVSASGSETRDSSSTPASAVIYDAYNSESYGTGSMTSAAGMTYVHIQKP